MMNRVGIREWRKYESVFDVIKNSGFDAYTYRNSPYRVAEDYLENRDEYIKNGKVNEIIENMIKVVGDVYYENTDDTTDGAVLYYSPKTQSIMHKKNPKLYKAVPPWNFDALKEVIVKGAENDDFRFFKYK